MLVQFAREPEYRELCESVYSIILFGAPHRGLNTTALEALVQGKRRERLIKDLKYDSSFLQNLNKGFSQISNPLKIISCYEMIETPTAKAKENDPESWDRTGPTEMMVEPGSAQLFTSNETEIAIDANHSNIAKLERVSEAYQRLKEIMTKHINSAPSIIDARFSRQDTVNVLDDIDRVSRGLVLALRFVPLLMATAANLGHVLDFFTQFKDFLQDDVSAAIFIRESVSTQFASRILMAVRDVQAALLPYQEIASHQRSIPWIEQNAFHGIRGTSTNISPEPLFEIERVANLHDLVSRRAIHIRLLTTFAMLGIEESVSIETMSRSSAAQLLGIDKTALRQRLLQRASENLEGNFKPLNGTLNPKGGTSSIAIASFSPDHSTEECDVIIEYRYYGQDQSTHRLESSMKRSLAEQEERDKDQLARLGSLLRKVTEDFEAQPAENKSALSAHCVLRCLGYIVDPRLAAKKVAFLFQPPPGIAISSIKDLRSVIEKRSSHRSLEERFKIAWETCSAVLCIHSWGWLHKSIRSENVLIVTTSNALGFSSYLRGFEQARHTEDSSRFLADHELEQDLYRHPDRHGNFSPKFEKKHDLYALGVVLLEIGTLWTVKAILESWITRYRDQNLHPEPQDIAKEIRRHAATHLPLFMGSRYAELVRRCLESDFETLNPSANDLSEVSLSMDLYDLMLQCIEPGCRI